MYEGKYGVGQELPRQHPRHGRAGEAARAGQGRPQRRHAPAADRRGRGRVDGRAERARQADEVRRRAAQDRDAPSTRTRRSRCSRRRSSKTRQFRFRQKIGEIKLAQLGRMERSHARRSCSRTRTTPSSRRSTRSSASEKAEEELNEYTLWAENYPTDTKFRFDMASRHVPARAVRRGDPGVPAGPAGPQVPHRRGHRCSAGRSSRPASSTRRSTRCAAVDRGVPDQGRREVART